ncbi:mRNA_triphosphatase Cet1-like superfamily [Hexamita inflata]|uniref:mRNA 5'-phosphatase n=1 Tax=Hexamita inflata TaxID=28002 RepID=A0AA86TDS4_9EUKA|nr:mRNA triphosphatase Cet1-like superfamily [Hexamita inflata]
MTVSVSSALMSNPDFAANLQRANIEFEFRLGRLSLPTILNHPICSGFLRVSDSAVDVPELVNLLTMCKTHQDLMTTDFSRFQAPKSTIDSLICPHKFEPDVPEPVFVHLFSVLTQAVKNKGTYRQINFVQLTKQFNMFSLRQRTDTFTHQMIERTLKLNLNKIDYSCGQLGYDFRLSQALEIPFDFSLEDGDAERTVRTRHEFIIDQGTHKLIFDLTELQINEEYQRQVEMEVQIKKGVQNIEQILDDALKQGLALCQLASDAIVPLDGVEKQNGAQEQEWSNRD